MGNKDLSDLRQSLSVYSLKNEPYENAKSFWDTIASVPHKTARLPSLRARAYRKMEKRGWINIADLDDAVNKFPTETRQIFRRLRAHAAVSLNRHPPSFQMVLKPEGTITSYSPVPACVPYVVLKKNTNPMASDVNEYSSKDIDMLTDQSRALMRDWIYPPKQPSYDQDAPRRRSESDLMDDMSIGFISERKSIFTSGSDKKRRNSFRF